MYLSTRLSSSAVAAIGVIVSLTTLSGCANHKIIARVNGANVNEEEYHTAVSRIRANDFQGFVQQNIQTDAGGAGLVAVIKEKLLEKLAVDKNLMPTDETVNRYVAYLTRSRPEISSALETGQITKEELPRVIRDQMILVALGSNNATVPEEDIKKEYAAEKALYDYPEIVGIRVVPVPSQTEGIELLNKIKATGDFAGAAIKINPQAGVIRYRTIDRLPPKLKEALAPLKDGQLVPAPVTIDAPGSPSANIVVQLVSRMPKGDAKIEEAHEQIREHELQKLQPQLMKHSQDLLAEYNQQANVEVMIDRYKSIVKTALLPPPASSAIGGPGGAAPNGAAMQQRPGMAMRPGAGASMPTPTVRPMPSGGAAPTTGSKPPVPTSGGTPTKPLSSGSNR